MKNNVNEIDSLIKTIMEQKERVGEFSLDLYYNDIGKECERYVARIQLFPYGVVHFRNSSFMVSLTEAYRFITDYQRI